MLFQQTYLLLELAFFTCVSVFIFSLKFFSFLDKSEKGRISNLDGLRFFLSIAVVFHHMVYSYHWHHGAGWNSTSYDTNEKFGRFGVCLFFMLSSYLMTAKNMSEPYDFLKFYINRFFRIAPLLWFSSSICLVSAVILGRHLDTQHLVDHLVSWFNVGITADKPDINSFRHATLINAGVTWTLPWEWFLYFSLPIVLIARQFVHPFIVTQLIIFTSIFLFSRIDYQISCYILCFACGMLARDIKGAFKINKYVNSVSILVCILLLF